MTERFVTTPEEVLAVIEEGKSGRHVSVTSEWKGRGRRQTDRERGGGGGGGGEERIIHVT